MSNAGTVRVVALFKAKPDQRDPLKVFLIKLIEPTRKEPGCLRYELHQNKSDPTDFVFIEEWESDATLDAHLASPHVQGALPLMGQYLTAPPDIRRYLMVEA